MSKTLSQMSDDELKHHHQSLKKIQQYSSSYSFDDILNKKADLSPLSSLEYSMAANMCFYRKDKQSFFSEIMESLYTDRVKYKKLMKDAKKKVQNGDKSYLDTVSKFDNMQMGLKIL